MFIQSKFLIRKNFFFEFYFLGQQIKNILVFINFQKKIDKKPYALGGDVVVYPSKVKRFLKKQFSVVEKIKKNKE